MNDDLELSVFLAAGRLETLQMQRDQAEFEFRDALAEAIRAGLPANAAARAANLTMIELLSMLGLPSTAIESSAVRSSIVCSGLERGPAQETTA